MIAVTLKDAKARLEYLVDKVVVNSEPTIISTDQGQSIVMVSLDEYNTWQETLYLLSTPANTEHLQNSISQDQAGKVCKHSLIEN